MKTVLRYLVGFIVVIATLVSIPLIPIFIGMFEHRFLGLNWLQAPSTYDYGDYFMCGAVSLVLVCVSAIIIISLICAFGQDIHNLGQFILSPVERLFTPQKAIAKPTPKSRVASPSKDTYQVEAEEEVEAFLNSQMEHTMTLRK